MKVMIVDDEKPIRQWFEFILRDIPEIEISASCPNGQMALEACELNTPNLILTDIIMPVMNGIELIRQIKEHYPQVAVLILSNFDDFEYVYTGLRLGAYDYLLKAQTDDELVISVIRKLQNELAASKKDEAPVYGSVVVNKMVRYIHKNYARKLKLGDLSQQLNYHPDYLSWLFKQHTGKNFNTYLSEYRMERAKEMLLQDNKRIKDVAFAVGFSNEMYFSTAFKNVVGMSPKRYIEKMAK